MGHISGEIAFKLQRLSGSPYWRRVGQFLAGGNSDFSHAMPKVLKLLDERGCDTVLFSLFSIVPRDSFRILAVLKKLELYNIKTVFLEEFQDGETRMAGQFIVYHLTDLRWDEYRFCQKFGTLTGMGQTEINDFVQKEMQKRILGNCCVLLCGETNGVKYSPKDRQINDTYGLREAIPDESRVILNPIHDRMTRFEMKLKRRFLSENGRWVISVWNKGGKDKNGRTKDGTKPAWTAFYNGNEIEVDLIQNLHGVEIGILDIK